MSQAGDVVDELLYPDTVTALMAKMIKNHNKEVAVPSRQIPHARLHDLRHLHATTLLLAGVQVHVSDGKAEN